MLQTARWCSTVSTEIILPIEGKAGKNGKWDGSALQKRLDYEDTRQKWLSGIAPQSYAIQAKMPVYLIVSANSPYDDATNANKMFLRLNKNSKFLLLPMVMDCLPDEYVDGIVRWCKGNYADEDIALQQFPTERGDNFVKVTTSVAPSKVSVWYSRNVNGCARNWVKAPIKRRKSVTLRSWTCTNSNATSSPLHLSKAR